jgi:hypothetical protein
MLFGRVYTLPAVKMSIHVASMYRKAEPMSFSIELKCSNKWMEYIIHYQLSIIHVLALFCPLHRLMML